MQPEDVSLDSWLVRLIVSFEDGHVDEGRNAATRLKQPDVNQLGIRDSTRAVSSVQAFKHTV